MSEFLDFLKKTNNDLSRIIDDVGKTETVINYWSKDNKDVRRDDERQIREINRKSDVFLMNSAIMWVVMVVVTIVCWILYDVIIGWLGIGNAWMAFFTMFVIDAAINLIIAIVLLLFRR